MMMIIVYLRVLLFELFMHVKQTHIQWPCFTGGFQEGGRRWRVYLDGKDSDKQLIQHPPSLSPLPSFISRSLVPSLSLPTHVDGGKIQICCYFLSFIRRPYRLVLSRLHACRHQSRVPAWSPSVCRSRSLALTLSLSSHFFPSKPEWMGGKS